MKKVGFIVSALVWAFYSAHSIAHEAIWQCGIDYTDNPLALSGRTCHLLKIKRIVSSPSARIQPDTQRKRDESAKTILEAELHQAERLHEELSRTATNTPHVQAAILRTKGDIAGLRREIERLR